MVEAFDKDHDGESDAEDCVTRHTFDLASNRRTPIKGTGNYDNAGFAADETTTCTYDAYDSLMIHRIQPEREFTHTF